jgi:flagellar protein FlaG
MLIQNISSAASASGFTSDSGPVAVAAPRTQAAPVELPQVATKPAAEKQAAQQSAQPTAAQLKSAVDNINRAMKENNSNVEFSIDKDTKQTVIRVVESQTGQLIRQFPSEEVLAISRMIGETQHGMLVKQQA